MSDIPCNFHSKPPINNLGIHPLDTTQGTETVEELLSKAPQQARKRQTEQHRDLLNNIYNLGSGKLTAKFDEAANAMLSRTYPDIANNCQTDSVFIPESFIPRVPIGVDTEHYKNQFDKLSASEKKEYNFIDRTPELDGDLVEKTIYSALKRFYKKKEVVVLQGADILIPAAKKRGLKQEMDMIIINNKLKYVMNIEAKLTLSNVKRSQKNESSIESALNQISRTKNIFERYFSRNISSDWLFIGMIGFTNIDKDVKSCSECATFLTKTDEIEEKLEAIEELIKARGRKGLEKAHSDYKLMVKHLIFTVFANPGPNISWNFGEEIFKTMMKKKGQGEYRSILFWTPSQFQIMQLDEDNHPVKSNVLFISSMSTGKTECKKGMIDKLLNEGQKCHFIFYNQRCAKKTILQVQLEHYYTKNKNKDNLVLSFINIDGSPVNQTDFFVMLEEKISKFPGHNTFIDELTLPKCWTEMTETVQKLVRHMAIHPDKPCLWITIAGIAFGTLKDNSLQKMKSIFPDFFIPTLRFPLRNCKGIITYVVGGKGPIEFDHDGDSGTSFLDIDVPDNLIEGQDPKNLGDDLEQAMQLVSKKQGRRGVAILFNYWPKGSGHQKHNMIIEWIMEGIKKAGREAIHYSCEDEMGVPEEILMEWIKERGDVDLVADLSAARGWEESTVVIVDCNNGRGLENLCMRTVSNLIIVKLPQLLEKTMKTTDKYKEDTFKDIGIPNSKGTSREASPNREGFGNSDESKKSSPFSEKSLDYRSDTLLNEIIDDIASNHWADRKDGLLNLQSYLREGKKLSGSEIRRVTGILTKMFMDTKGFALFLETLCELVLSHKADLYDWLYILLTRLLTKLGTDLLGSLVHKINRTLDVVRESFSCEDQLIVIFKFLVDQTQTPNTKVKVATLQYLKTLVILVESKEIPINMSAMAKIITWLSEPESKEIRQVAQQTLVSMFNTHTTKMTQIVALLPQVYQDNAAEVLGNQLPPGESPLKPTSPSPVKPKALQAKPDEVNKSSSPSPLCEMSPEDIEDKTLVQDMITNLNALKVVDPGMEKNLCLRQLITIARSGNTNDLNEHFETLLRVLLEYIEDGERSSRALVLGVLTEMLKQKGLQGRFHMFTELVILKLLQAHKDHEKEVVRAAESCASTMAEVLPADEVVRVLNPIVRTQSFPVNHAAIKMLTTLVKKETPESVEAHLAEIMEGLLKAYHNVDSPVRKAAVFCIVSLHQLLGEAVLQPHLDCLNGSKMLLLSFYINRAYAKARPVQLEECNSPALLPHSASDQQTFYFWPKEYLNIFVGQNIY